MCIRDSIHGGHGQLRFVWLCKLCKQFSGDVGPVSASLSCVKFQQNCSNAMVRTVDSVGMMVYLRLLLIYYNFFLKRVGVGGSAGMQLSHLNAGSGMLLMQIQVPAVAEDFHPELTFSTNSFTVFLKPLCAIACINMCALIKNPKPWQPYHCLDTWKYSTH